MLNDDKMKNVISLFFSLVVVLFFNMCLSQTEYDKEVLGTWTGTISGGGIATKNITIVITKSNYILNDTVHEGICEGYSMVNNGKKTTFTGKIIVEADMPILEVKEPKTSGKNGVFYLTFGCFTENGIDSELTCGTWTSYDKTLKREINVRKK
jgi:hypothetical protein